MGDSLWALKCSRTKSLTRWRATWTRQWVMNGFESLVSCAGGSRTQCEVLLVAEVAALLARLAADTGAILAGEPSCSEKQTKGTSSKMVLMSKLSNQ